MRTLSIAALLLAGAATPAAALAGGTYYVRNDTPRALSCGVRLPGSEATVRVALRPGAEWSQTTERDATRTLICYVGPRRLTFRMASGQRYSLREDDRGALWLRAIG
jgi:hypothetical protein